MATLFLTFRLGVAVEAVFLEVRDGEGNACLEALLLVVTIDD